MAQIKYEEHNFGQAALKTIAAARGICQAYAAQGFDLTLRQLYYQFVSRGLIANKMSEYKRLGDVVSNARMAGLLDWDYIVDRTRNVRTQAHWSGPEGIIQAAAQSHRLDKWADQPSRVEVWIEKDALTGVIDPVCTANDVSYFACRGYASQSEMWAAAMRLKRYIRAGQEPTILYLGDHDPSGIDMTRDVFDRLATFMGGGASVKRLALNMDQVDQYNPPPNPAKLTDSRAAGYVDLYGDESWELDALEPQVLAALIQDAITSVRDPDLWREAQEKEQTERDLLEQAADRWSELVDVLGG